MNRKSQPLLPPKPVPPAKSAEELSAEAIKLEEEKLMRALLAGEKAVCVRQLLGAAGVAFRKHDAEILVTVSVAARLLRARRGVVSGYLFSIVQEVDAKTLADLMCGLLTSLWQAGKVNRAMVEKDGSRLFVYDEGARAGIAALASQAAAFFCDLVDEKPDDIAGELPGCAAQLAETLSGVVRTRPELVRHWAEEQIAWPIMAMRHYPKEADFEKLAASIGLGAKAPVKPKRRHTWKPETKINRYILRQVIDERVGGDRPLTRETLDYYLNRALMPMFEVEAIICGGWEKHPAFADIAHSAAKRGKKGTQKSEVRNRVKKALLAFTS